MVTLLERVYFGVEMKAVSLHHFVSLNKRSFIIVILHIFWAILLYGINVHVCFRSFEIFIIYSSNLQYNGDCICVHIHIKLMVKPLFQIYLPLGTYVRVQVSGQLVNVWIVASPNDYIESEQVQNKVKTKTTGNIFSNFMLHKFPTVNFW